MRERERERESERESESEIEMGRAPCCDKANVKKGPWSPEEDAKLKEYIEKHGTGGNWIALPHKAGLKRCGKSCRLRWLNYLRPNIKHGEFSAHEDRIICSLFANIGSRWSIIAAQLPGRTDNDIKNYWNTKLKKKLMGIINPQAQTKPHQTTATYASLFQSSSSSSSPSSSSCSNNTTYYTTTQAYELPISIPSSILTTSSSPHELSFMDPMNHHQYYPVKESCSGGNILMFGGHEGSCNSSDGGSQNGDQRMGNFQNYCYNFGWNEMKPNGLWGESTSLDYASLEEIKQLINSSTNNLGTNNLFNIDENKTVERMMYNN